MPSINSNFDWVDTPNATERAFTITAKEGVNDMIPDFYNNVVLWSDCPQWIKKAEAIPETLQGYTLVNTAKAGYQTRLFTFGKTRTQQERDTPFQVTWVKRMNFWPTVLLKLWFEEGNLALSTNPADGNTLHTRSKSRDGAMYPTWFKTSRFLSERPWPRTMHKSPTPITDSINWSFDGSTGSFPECLHPDCRFPRFQTSGNVIYGAGTAEVEIGSDLMAQEFPATSMTDWEVYPVEDTVQNINGFWFRELVEAYPPIDDRENIS